MFFSFWLQTFYILGLISCVFLYTRQSCWVVLMAPPAQSDSSACLVMFRHFFFFVFFAFFYLFIFDFVSSFSVFLIFLCSFVLVKCVCFAGGRSQPRTHAVMHTYKTKQNKTKQNKTKQNKTKQNSTVQYSTIQYNTYTTHNATQNAKRKTQHDTTGHDRTRHDTRSKQVSPLCVCFVCCVAGLSVRAFQEEMDDGERETWRRHAAATGATHSLNLDILSSKGSHPPGRCCLDLGTRERCT